MNNYAILHEKEGWLLTTAVWDGDTNKWQPEEGFIAVPAESVDYSSLPPSPYDQTPTSSV